MKKLFSLLLLCPCLSFAQHQVRGTITTITGAPVPGAHVSALHSKSATTTNTSGVFSITLTTLPDTLLVSHVSYKSKLFPLSPATPATIAIILEEAVNQLNETVIIAYGTTTRRLNTGSVAKLPATQITTQPVSDPLTALTGRLTGVTVAQSSGVPGTTVKIRVRGRNSIAQGSDPLFIVDGVPFASGNQPVNNLGSILTGELGTGLSPFSTLAPADIESIEVLKDADATAIYGSRGANGVVLITTKKASAGKTQIAFSLAKAISSVTRTMPMLNTQQYLSLRKEAFANDAVTPTATNAPDLLLWDTTRYTDFKKTFIGGTAPTTEARLSITGGNTANRLLFSGNYRKEGTVFPGSMNVQRGTGTLSFQHDGPAKKLTLNASTSYSYNSNKLTAGDLAFYLNLPPNYPGFYNADGSLKWEQGGVTLSNPYSNLLRTYKAATQQMNSRAQLSWRPFIGLQLSTSAGFNTLQVNETSVTPIAAQNPAGSPFGTLDLSSNSFESWIIEPQASYECMIFKGILQLLTGATLQDSRNNSLSLKATGYTSDNLLQSLAAAPSLSQKNNAFSQYRYQALFARLNYNYRNRYILNASGRRDGSTRFGPGRRFSNFGAVGAAWLFSNENFWKNTLPALSYGKLRASYGTSGNDQIGDYQYLDNWRALQPYQSGTALAPVNLFNANYQWEVNRKLELALETGFFNDRLLTTLAFYRNRSGNQLVAYQLPTQTGFSSVLRNHDAVVQNTGIEAELSAKTMQTKSFEWTTTFNITLPKNKLLSFKDLATSSYVYAYVIGQPLSVINLYHYLGVDPATGVMSFEDVDKDGALGLADLQVNGNTDPAFYGGFGNTFRYRNLSIDIFAEFKKQTGRNYLYSLYSGNTVPGMRFNMPVAILDRWQKPGDVTAIQRLTASTSSAAYAAANTLLTSDGIYSDASYLRLKTVALNLALPAKWLQRIKAQSANIYLQAQNLFTITNFKGSDPETQQLYTLPPLRTIACGLSITL